MRDGAQFSSPWKFVPSLYFLQGLPNVIVTTLSVTMYKTLGVPNDQIALWTSLIAWPWTVKMLWGPLVDNTATKRFWILAMQACIIAVLGLLAFAVPSSAFFPLTLGGFFLIAFLSATHDIAADGFYILSMPEERQAFFVGVRSAFFRLAMIFGPGVLVILAGRIGGTDLNNRGQIVNGWVTALVIGAAVYALGWLVHLWTLPKPAEDIPREPFQLQLVLLRFAQVLLMLVAAVIAIQLLVIPLQPLFGVPQDSVFWPVTGGDHSQNVWQVPAGLAVVALATWSTYRLFEDIGMGPAAKEYIGQNRVQAVLAFILFYRFGESMISKMSTPFLLDPVEKGGLGVTAEQSGTISGTLGVIALTVGGILGGALIAKHGIKKCLWPMVLSLNVPNLLYVWAAFTKPGLVGVGAVIAIDQLGYGFGFSAYMVYLMFISQGSKFQTSHYAISTGLMALGAMLAGIVSGKLQVAFANSDPTNGYAWFFVAVCLCTIPGMLTLFFIPLDKADIKSAPIDLD
jgi:PAT family beta-lactamase induction signal transducer AmpG